MLRFTELRFSPTQIEKAEKIVDRVICTKEGWNDAILSGVPKRVHWMHCAVPSSNGGEYLVYVGGYNGSVRVVHCHCAAGQDNVPCYHVKAVLLWLESRLATRAARSGQTLAHAFAQTAQVNALLIA